MAPRSSNDLTVVSVEATMFKVDGGHDGHRFECVLCIELSNGQYHEIEVESVTNPRDWVKEIVK